ncbi:MAG: chemotaxis protein CheA [Desulfuromonadia bacterium]
MAIEIDDPELLEGFLTETTELLEKLDDDLVSLEKSPDDTELMNRIFRSIHTVKGASSFLGFDLLVRVTHRTEDVLNRLRKGEMVVTPDLMDVILEAVDLVKVLVSDIKGGEIQEREIDGTIARLEAYMQMESAPPASPPSEASPVSPPPPPTAGEPAAAPPSVKPDVKTQGENGGKSLPPQPKGPKPQGEDLSDSTTVRIDVKRIDDLMNQVGELVLERNRLLQLDADYRAGTNLENFSEEFAKLAKRISFITSEVQMQVLKIRMIPVEKVFKKFPRIVRNIARDLGKEVELQVFGEETELDRSVVDEIGDPLTHLIRNSLDHGIEMPDDRERLGKPRTGTVVLSANHEGNQIVISIKDDGRGIDPDRVAAKALEKGLVTQAQLAAMGQREILDLIFLPGFSTKEVTTDLSGRGVGMDVVRTNIKKLNGIIDIRNEPGQGTEFLLRLPLTLAIIQSLLVEVEGEIYSIPLSAVFETLRVEGDDFHVVGGQEVMRLRDSVLPLIRLDQLFGVGRKKKRDACYVVVIGVAEKRIGVIVTRLLGQQEVAIKSLGKYLARLPGIAGSTILGDGRVALIVDPVGLVEGKESGTPPRLTA